MIRPTFLEVNLSAIRQNIKKHQKVLPAGASLMAVVKADGYGHGARQVLEAAIKEKVNWAGVGLIEEAIALREAGVSIPIAMLGGWHPDAIPYLFQYDITPNVYSFDLAEKINKFAEKIGRVIKVHLKIETGMGRLGFNEEQFVEFLQNRDSYPFLQLDGIATHLSSADEEEQEFTLGQVDRFFELLDRYSDRRQFNWIHICNSAGTTLLENSRGNLFRVGIGMYGMPPSQVENQDVMLVEAITWKSAIVQLQWFPPNSPISYGKTYYTDKETLVATICVGYADGYSRLLSNKGSMLIRGQRAPVIGRVCMDLTLVDVTHIKDVALGDEVVLIGRQKEEHISATEIADLIDTINYEVVCNVSKRVPRVYIDEE